MPLRKQWTRRRLATKPATAAPPLSRPAGASRPGEAGSGGVMPLRKQWTRHPTNDCSRSTPFPLRSQAGGGGLVRFKDRSKTHAHPHRRPLQRSSRAKSRRAHHLRHGRRSRSCDLARDSQGVCPRRAPTSSKSACPSPTRWPTARRSRPPGLRALKAGTTLKKTLQARRGLSRRRPRDADRADGLLQSDLCLWRRRLPRRRHGGRRRRADRRRSAARGRRGALPAGARRRV